MSIPKDRYVWISRFFRVFILAILCGIFIGGISGFIITGHISAKYILKGVIIFGIMGLFIILINISKINETP